MSLAGFSSETFDEAAQLSFRMTMALVLDVDLDSIVISDLQTLRRRTLEQTVQSAQILQSVLASSSWKQARAEHSVDDDIVLSAVATAAHVTSANSLLNIDAAAVASGDTEGLRVVYEVRALSEEKSHGTVEQLGAIVAAESGLSSLVAQLKTGFDSVGVEVPLSFESGTVASQPTTHPEVLPTVVVDSDGSITSTDAYGTATKTVHNADGTSTTVVTQADGTSMTTITEAEGGVVAVDGSNAATDDDGEAAGVLVSMPTDDSILLGTNMTEAERQSLPLIDWWRLLFKMDGQVSAVKVGEFASDNGEKIKAAIAEVTKVDVSRIMLTLVPTTTGTLRVYAMLAALHGGTEAEYLETSIENFANFDARLAEAVTVALEHSLFEVKGSVAFEKVLSGGSSSDLYTIDAMFHGLAMFDDHQEPVAGETHGEDGDTRRLQHRMVRGRAEEGRAEEGSTQLEGAISAVGLLAIGLVALVGGRRASSSVGGAGWDPVL
jgi:hypothetical protein